MPAYKSFLPPSRVLMGPGPSEVPPRVLDALARPTIGHLDPAFVELMDEIKELLRYAFQTKNALTMPISGPGSAGMEACVVNLVEPGDTVIVCQNGVFGGRLKEMVTRAGGSVVALDVPWGRAIDPEKLRTMLVRSPGAALVAFVQAETSTGVLSDVRALAEVAREAGALTLVDAVTSLGGSELRTDDWALDAVYSGTQKCLSVPPGLSPITLGARAIEKLRRRKTPVQSWFMDLNLIVAYWEGEGAKRSYHHTAPVNALYGLHEGLLALQEEGLDASWERHRRNHLALRTGLESLGLTFAVPEVERLPQLNAIRIPPQVADGRIRDRLLGEFSLEIGAGLGPLAGKIWRIGLMGYGSRPENIQKCIRALASALSAEGFPAEAEPALHAAQEVLNSPAASGV